MQAETWYGFALCGATVAMRGISQVVLLSQLDHRMHSQLVLRTHVYQEPHVKPSSLDPDSADPPKGVVGISGPEDV